MTPLVALLGDAGGGEGGGEGAAGGGRDEGEEGPHGRAAVYSCSTGTDTDTHRHTDPETGPPTTARSTSTRRWSICKQYITWIVTANNPCREFQFQDFKWHKRRCDRKVE